MQTVPEPRRRSMASVLMPSLSKSGYPHLDWYIPPTGASVASRPSMMCALATPARNVSRHACTLGIIPASMTPLAISVSASLGRKRTDQRCGVRFIATDTAHVAEEDQLFGPRASATARAAVSALTLYFCVSPSSTSRHIEGITGTVPA